MPWHIERNHEGCSAWAVVKDSDDSLAGCHESRAQAEAQVAALYANEPKEEGAAFARALEREKR